ncbi:hypothetical protein [Pseudomonas helleri]|uniref:hypothetical protein n=1 Tax=Pseudomonas helleri TaxID=1608996 RepID=UPI003FD0A59C
MPKPYEVLERSFINGRLYEPGERVTLEIDSPGGNLKLLAAAAATVNASTGPQGAGKAAFSAKHNGGGRFIIIDASGDKVGEFTGSKEEAEAEAARLLAGGQIAPTTAPQGAGDGSGAGNAGGEGGNGLPDA